MQYNHIVTTTQQLKIHYTDSFKKYTLSASCMSVTDLGASDFTMSKTVLASRELTNRSTYTSTDTGQRVSCEILTI